MLLAQLRALDALVSSGALSARERSQLAAALALSLSVSIAALDGPVARLLDDAAAAEARGAEPLGFTLAQLDAAAALGAPGASFAGAATAAADALTAARVAHAFAFTSPLDVRLQARRERVARGLLGDAALTFGEAAAAPVLRVLRAARVAAGLREPGGALVDVGSGAGRALVAAALAADFDALRGEEVLETLHVSACEAAKRAGALIERDAERAAALAALAPALDAAAARALRAALEPPPLPVFILRLGDALAPAPEAALTEVVVFGAAAAAADGPCETLPWPAVADVVLINAPCFPSTHLRRLAALLGEGSREGAAVASVASPLDAWDAALVPHCVLTEALEFGDAAVFVSLVQRRAPAHVAAPSPPAASQLSPRRSPGSSLPAQKSASPPATPAAAAARISRAARARHAAVSVSNIWSVGTGAGAAPLSSPFGARLQAAKAAAQRRPSPRFDDALSSDSDDDALAALTPDGTPLAGGRAGSPTLTLPRRAAA
jgi:hypothetical protein